MSSVKETKRSDVGRCFFFFNLTEILMLISLLLGQWISSLSRRWEVQSSWKPMDFACGNVIGREVWERKPPGVTPYNGLYGKALPERGNFFRFQVY